MRFCSAAMVCINGLSIDALGSALSLTAPHVALARLFDGALRGSARDNLTAVVIRQ